MALAVASPYLALLDEPDYSLKAYALQSLDENVNQLWAEIADHLSQIEELYEDKNFPSPQLAALVASKVYYNLGEFDSSMKFALVAEDKFDLSQNNEYIEAIVSKCINRYIKLSQQLYDLPPKEVSQLPESEQEIDPKLTAIVERMLSRCVERGDFKLALGVAMEARRLDVVDRLIKENNKSIDSGSSSSSSSSKKMELIIYTLDCAVSVVGNRQFRNHVLEALVPIILSFDSPDYFSLAKIIVQLNDSKLATQLFTDLLSKGGENDTRRLIAYQVAFDLVAAAPQEFLESVTEQLTSQEEKAVPPQDIQYTKLLKILSGVPTCDFNITFLKKHNNTDLTILDKTKSYLEGRSSIFHNAVSFENAFLHAGTTADGFFRANLEWLSKATNWTKFSATAALGVIHQGNLSQGRRILQPYLPENQGSCYTQGGSLYGLGLIFAGHGRQVLDYLRKHVTETGANVQGSESEVILHGAALGVGVAGMGSRSSAIYNELKEVLFSDSAIAGEGTGLAMGLVMLGSKNTEAEEEMLQYAHDTKHEKIIRSLAIGVALINYGKEEAADETIEKLINEQDPILRYGGAFTIALAYAGTGNNRAIKKLLHIAVSDASDDVRRSAMIGLGFILLRNYTAVPRMVELLSESHNPHVRYGSALALGISCAGTGLKEAVDVLEPMIKDPVDFVRQGAMIALAMVLIQQNEKLSPKVKEVHEVFAKVITSKHEDAMAKFGAALAQGIIDAGGRNVTITNEYGQTGVLNMKAVVGLAVFVQFWYWFPLSHFLSLAFSPTSITGVREDLKIPQFEFDCHAKLKWFGYPPKATEKETNKPEKITTAILSTTIRAKNLAKKSNEAKKQKNKKKYGDKDGDDEDDQEMADDAAENVNKKQQDDEDTKMEGVEKTGSASDRKEDQQKSGVDGDGNSAADAEEQITRSAKTYKVENMSRVLPTQLKYISFPEDGRFVPVRKFRGDGGVVVITDKTPRQPAEFIKTVRQVQSPDEVDEDEEAPLPRPFKWNPPAVE